jgi:hypothetical protein
MLNHEPNPPAPLLRLPRLIAGEWRCLDCCHLSYGQADEPRCPNCLGRRLVPTVEHPIIPVRPRQTTP